MTSLIFSSLNLLQRRGIQCIFYHITLEDANRVRREMGLPEM
jgi:hypothetical protein